MVEAGGLGDATTAGCVSAGQFNAASGPGSSGQTTRTTVMHIITRIDASATLRRSDNVIQRHLIAPAEARIVVAPSPIKDCIPA